MDPKKMKFYDDNDDGYDWRAEIHQYRKQQQQIRKARRRKYEIRSISCVDIHMVGFVMLVVVAFPIVAEAGWVSSPLATVAAFCGSNSCGSSSSSSSKKFFTAKSKMPASATSSSDDGSSDNSETIATYSSTNETSDGNRSDIFQEFCTFLQTLQKDIIQTVEDVDGSGETFSKDTWGRFSEQENEDESPPLSGGITRVIQGGNIVEKGACSFTLIQQGILTSERAATIRARQVKQNDDTSTNNDFQIQAGDIYSAAALSIVFHTRSPLIPTFRSDLRIFMVQSSFDQQMAWFGGGADLTPYYLDEEDISNFHMMYKNLCTKHQSSSSLPNHFANYDVMKKECDDYFYLPARSEHRGTGGIFFDDKMANPETLDFCQGVGSTWMKSWLPIIEKHRDTKYTPQQKQWQKLRRGRYLEFNLLYDRGVKFGLANANPRVEGVMVSAPPEIAFEYRHTVEEGSEEDKLLKVLKKPREWVE